MKGQVLQMKIISWIAGIGLIVLSPLIYYIGKLNCEIERSGINWTPELDMQARQHFKSAVATSRYSLIAGVIVLAVALILSLRKKK